MTYEMIMVLVVLAIVLGGLIFTKISADAILLGGLTMTMIVPVPDPAGGWKVGILSPEIALSGFSNSGLITVAVLFVVVTGLRETGGIDMFAERLLGRPKKLRTGLIRLMVPTFGLSVFLNNTPVVAMMIPVVMDWCRKQKFAVSKVLIPLSYASILGGTCSLIGTSTNLVVAGMVSDTLKDRAARNVSVDSDDIHQVRMFDITPVGLVSALLAGGLLLLIAPKLLPDRSGSATLLSDPREYTLEMIIPQGSALNDKTVEQAGLRRLPGCYLAEISRDDNIIAPVEPRQKLHIGDRLRFVGVVESIRDLQNIRGLEPATDQIFKLDSPRYRRLLFEAVVSTTCPVAGKTIREGEFRNRYNAVVIAVARSGKRLTGRIGDIELKPGDVLLLEADAGFGGRYRNSRDFLLVSGLRNSVPRRHNRAPIAVALMVLMIGAATAEIVSMAVAALVAAGLMVGTRCCSLTQARRSVDWTVLIVIGSALGLGFALEETGAAHQIATAMVSLAGGQPWLALAMVYLTTMLLTELITNNAAAALMYPFALATAEQLGVNFMPFVICLMMAASASFSTPIGYQTNLMVYGPGGYRFMDFLRVGIIMNFTMAVISIVLIPFVFPFK